MEDKILYNSSDIEVMKIAENALSMGKDRIVEIRNYAKLAGFKRIGIANCISLQKETYQLKEMLSDDFEVYTIDCRCGRLPANEFLGDDAKGVMCNPAGQAKYLEENNTELNIVMGLCIGHDMMFTSKSIAPSTTLIVKDRKHKYNPIEIFNNLK
ncbi:MAG: DUF1847 domain-containing protein [Bacteroidetes bacterium]|nr:DUF1847 domain-containing protein [Bacteroidota bacterium]